MGKESAGKDSAERMHADQVALPPNRKIVYDRIGQAIRRARMRSESCWVRVERYRQPFTV
jgi:hypothetical protein